MLLWGDSTARPYSSFSSRSVYLRSASSPAPAIVPRSPIDGILSPTATLRPVPLLVSPSLQSPSLSSPETIASSNGDDSVALVWQPPSPPVSEFCAQAAMDQVMSFIRASRPLAQDETKQDYKFSMMREFHNVAPPTHECILHRLECKLFEYHPKARVDYFGDLSQLVITIPSRAHELVAVNAQYSVRQLLFNQGFYWPEWGGSIDRIELTGSTDRKLTRAGHNASVFQPDGSLNLAGVDLPFLIIEVADTESYKHARTKSRKFLMASKGKTRFVILIDLVRKTTKEMNDLTLNNGPEFDDGLGNPEEALPAQSFPKGNNKRAALDNEDSPEINKRTRTLSPEPPPQSPALPLLPPPTPYSRAMVTVLTTHIIDHPKLNGQKLRTMEKLIDEAECWPTVPAQDVCFSFSWEDMNVADYPAELRDCKFTVRFEWLNELLQNHFEVFQGMPKMLDDTSDVVYEDESELDSEDAAIEKERLWAVEAKVDSGKVESDDSWK